MTKRDEKMQSYMFKCLLNDPEAAYYSDYGEDSVAIAWSGFELYVLSKKDICFNLDKCKNRPNLNEFLKKTSEDKELALTDTLKQLEKNYCRKLKAEDFVVWVNDKYIKDFGEVRYYASRPLDRVLITDIVTNEIIGLVLPIRVKDEK